MPNLEILKYDRWETRPINDLEEGDTFRHEGRIFKSQGEAEKREDGWHIPGKRADNGPITLAVGERYSKIEAVVMVMDFCMSTLHEFEDGTCMIASLERGEGYIYTPRLPEAELNDFCNKHLDHYEDFFRTNQDAIEDGQYIPMTRFWN